MTYPIAYDKESHKWITIKGEYTGWSEAFQEIKVIVEETQANK